MNEIKGVEVFSAGTWNDEKYTVDDLHEMVKAFNENSTGARPYLKLGHDPKQRVLKKALDYEEHDGMPAAGWIQKIYVVGEKLVADFFDIPERIYKLIQQKTYRKVSSEIFHNITIGEKKYGKMLAAVALLGADNPGVMNLNDIMSVYKKFEGSYDKIEIDNEIEFSMNSENITPKEKGKNVMSKTENEIKLEFELNQKEAALKTATEKLEATEADQKEKEQELEDLKKFKADAEKREQSLLLDAKKAKVEKFVTELQAEKLCTVAMKPLITELLGEDKKEYSVKVNDKEEKLSKENLLKEALKLYKASTDVNFEESSSVSDTEREDKEAKLDEQAKKYASEHKVSYGAALKAVMKQEQ